jgi:hypothetical protein
MARAIDMKQLGVASDTSLQMWISGLGLSSLVGSSITVEKTFAFALESTPVHGRLAAEMRLGEVPFAPSVVSERQRTW